MPSKHSVVCIKHFDERFIIQEDTFKRPDGSSLSVKRDRLKLSNSAYSNKFEIFHSIYQKDFQLLEKNPEDRKEEIRKRQEEIQNSREGKDNIADFLELKGNFHCTL